MRISTSRNYRQQLLDMVDGRKKICSRIPDRDTPALGQYTNWERCLRPTLVEGLYDEVKRRKGTRANGKMIPDGSNGRLQDS